MTLKAKLAKAEQEVRELRQLLDAVRWEAHARVGGFLERAPGWRRDPMWLAVVAPNRTDALVLCLDRHGAPERCFRYDDPRIDIELKALKAAADGGNNAARAEYHSLRIARRECCEAFSSESIHECGTCRACGGPIQWEFKAGVRGWHCQKCPTVVPELVPQPAA